MAEPGAGKRRPALRARLWRAGQSARVAAGRLTGRVGAPEPTTTGEACPDVGAWAAEHQGAVPRQLFAGRDLVRSLPHTVEPAVAEVYLQRTTDHLGARYRVPVRGARIVGDRGLVVLPDGSASVESVYVTEQLEQVPEFASPRRVPVRRLPGDHYSLLVPWVRQFNYYHWCHDSLLRLHDVLDDLPAQTRFVVPGWLRPVQYETLGLLGIGKDRLVHCTGMTTLELETLHFATWTTLSGHHRGEADRWLSGRFLDALGVAPRGEGRRLFVSRRHARRKTANEAEVVALLDEFGFEVVVAEELSFAEQAARFAEAAVIVGSHGAGLYNMTFAPPGAVVVDMIGESHLFNGFIYWSMALEAGHEYWYFLTESSAVEGDQSDTVIPLGKLEATLLGAGVDRRR